MAWMLIVVGSPVSAALFYLGSGSPRIELGNLADWLAAIGAFVAAVAALYIATRDRRDRKLELLAAEEAQARLVRVSARFDRDAGEYVVQIRNVGDRAIIRPSVASAALTGRPQATWRATDFVDVIEPERDSPAPHESRLTFSDADGDPVPRLHALMGENFTPVYEGGVPDATVTVQFADANGNRWITGPLMDPKKLVRLGQG